MRVYADNAATTKISQKAKEALITCMDEYYGNPSSIHTPGQRAHEELERARTVIAGCIGADPTEIYFTSGGTESDNQAIRSAAYSGAKKGRRHLVSSTIEHHAVLHTLKALEREGFEVSLIPVDGNGMIDPRAVQAALRDDTALVTIMYANNEIGTIEPIAEISAVCREHDVVFHTDAVQAVGHLAIDVHELKVDMLSLSGHKFHGPRGVGALYIRKGTALLPFIEGGAQERGKRAGTENLPAIVGMAAALQECCDRIEERSSRVSALRDRLIEGLSAIGLSHLNGHPTKRLPGNVSMCFEGIEGEALLLTLDAKGVAASSGSACTSGSLDPSHVLLAIGRPHEIAHGSLRLSLDDGNTEEDIDYIVSIMPGIVDYLRNMSPVWEKIEKEQNHALQR